MANLEIESLKVHGPDTSISGKWEIGGSFDTGAYARIAWDGKAEYDTEEEAKEAVIFIQNNYKPHD